MWVVFTLVYALIEKGILGDSTHYPSTGNPYDFSSGIVSNLVLSTITALAIGIFEVRYLNRLFDRRSFGVKIALKALVYLAIIIAFLLVAVTINNVQKFDVALFDAVVWNSTWNFPSSFAFWSVAMFIAAIICVDQAGGERHVVRLQPLQIQVDLDTVHAHVGDGAAGSDDLLAQVEDGGYPARRGQ